MPEGEPNPRAAAGQGTRTVAAVSPVDVTDQTDAADRTDAADERDAAVDALYEGAPEDFTTARDALAKRLRAGGDKDGAAAVKALRRPTAAAWALNQLARRSRERVAALTALGAELREAQSSALAGGGAARLRELAARRRDLVEELTRTALGYLGPGGDTHRETVAATLDAALASPDAAHALEAGRLARPLDPPSGFPTGTDVEDDEPTLRNGAAVAGHHPAPEDGLRAGERGPGESPVAGGARHDGPAADGPSARDRRRAARAERRSAGGPSGAGPATARENAPRAHGSREAAASEDAARDGTAARRRAEVEVDVAAKEQALRLAREEAHQAAREAAAARAEASRLQDELVTANGRAKAAAERARVAQWAQARAQQELDAARGGRDA